MFGRFTESPIEEISKSDERIAFMALVFIIIPALAVGFIATYGFLVWMYQLLTV